jgi:hypothetical protein
MDNVRFDRLTLTVSTLLTRRTLAGVLGPAALAFPHGIDGKKRKKRKKKKVRRNSFGCVNVGGYCKNSGQCCSGICQGKKGKKKCQAHDTGGCQPGHSTVTCGGEDVLCPSEDGVCTTTTGKAAFCFDIKFQIAPPCTRDADCEAGWDGAVACILCGDFGTICAGAF